MKICNWSKNWFVIGYLAAAVLAGSALAGCASHAKVETGTSASVGQQLQDLEKSYKDGIITQKEYEKLKQAIIKKND